MDDSTPDTPASQAGPEFAELRENYQRAALRREALDPDPFAQFVEWFEDARDSGVPEPNAMSLATCGGDGDQPSVRTVLLKGLEGGGLDFFTNYESRKGRDLAANPHAGLLFLWKEVERQVLVRGRVEKLDRETSEVYFHSRPYGSRIGAWASLQSEAIPNHAWLEERDRDYRDKYPETGSPDEVPLPPGWGGYRLIPAAFEFWQGRPNRLHDRFEYARGEGEGEGGDTWQISRLSP